MKMKNTLFLSLLLSVLAVLTSFNVNAALIAAPSSVKLKANVCGFTVKFEKSKSNVKGYIINYSANKSFSNSKIVKVNSSKTSKTIKHLKSGKKYYVKICAYKNNSKSKWTKVKFVKTKKKTMTSIAVKGLWYLYSPQDTVADVFNLYSNGSCKHMYMSCNGKKVDQYRNTVVRSCKISSNTMTIYGGIKKHIIKYVKSGDYGKYTTTFSSGPMNPQKVTFKVYHYADHPSGSRFMKDWNNKFIK